MKPINRDELEECELRLLQAIWNLEEALLDIRKSLKDLQIRFDRLTQIEHNR